MDGWMHAWMHGCMDAWMHGDGYIEIDGWMHGWMDGCMDDIGPQNGSTHAFKWDLKPKMDETRVQMAYSVLRV